MFPFSGSSIVKTMIYFDNAATTFPKPRTILPALQNAVLYYGGNPGRSGHTISMKTSEKVFEVKKEKKRQSFLMPRWKTLFLLPIVRTL